MSRCYVHERCRDHSVAVSGPYPHSVADEVCKRLRAHGIGAFISGEKDILPLVLAQHPDWWGVPLEDMEELSGYDRWLEKRFGIIVKPEQPTINDDRPYPGPTEQELAQEYGVPVSDPDTVTDDPGDREGWQ